MDWNRISGWLGIENSLDDSRQHPKSLLGSRHPAIIMFALLAVAFIAETLARGFLPWLLRNHPLLLIILDSHTHYLLLASTKIGAAGFITVGIIWRLSVHILYYLLGRWYGADVMGWLGRRSRLVRLLVDRLGRIFARVANPAVLLLSDDFVCFLAGYAGMSPLRFLILHSLGTVLHIVVLFVLARHIHHSLVPVASFIDSDTISVSIIFVVIAVGAVAYTVVTHRHHLRELAGGLRRGKGEGPDHDARLASIHRPGLDGGWTESAAG